MYEGCEWELRFPLAVCVSYQQGNRGKHSLVIRAYVACDPADCAPKEVEALYQSRSTIETAFRTMPGRRTRTSTTYPVVRLLFVLVSFLLRNLWVIVRWGVLATPRRDGRALPVWFRFEVFRDGLATLSKTRWDGSGKRRLTVSTSQRPTVNWTRAETARVQR